MQTPRSWFRAATCSLLTLLTSSAAFAQCTPGWQTGFVLPGTDLDIYDSAYFDIGDGAGPRLYICGQFSFAGGTPISGVARWNGAAWEPVGGGFYNGEFGQTGTVLSLVMYKGQLYAAGSFAFVGNHTPGIDPAYTNALNIARLDASDPAHPGWGPLASDLYALWDANGLTNISHTDGTNPWVSSMAVDDRGTPATADDILYIAGQFKRASDEMNGDQLVHSVVQWNGSTFDPVGGGLGLTSGFLGVATTIAMYNGELYVGAGSHPYLPGGFPSAGGIPGTANFAKWNPNTSTWSTTGYAPPSTPSIGKLFVDPAANVLYFSDCQQFQHAKVVRFDGASFTQVGSPAIDIVRDFAVFDAGSGPRLYAAGDTDYLNGMFGPVAVAIQSWNGSAWENLPDHLAARATVGRIHTLSTATLAGGSRLVAAGSFNTFGSSVASNITAFNGAAWSALPEAGRQPPGFLRQCSSGCTGRSWNVIEGDEDGPGPRPTALYAYGNFSTGDPSGPRCVARFEGTSWMPLGSSPVAPATNAMALDAIFADVGGIGTRLHVQMSDGSLRRWEPSTSTWSTVLPGNSLTTTDTAHAVVFDDDGAGPNPPAIYAFGFILNGVEGARALAKWDGSTSAWVQVGSSFPTPPGTTTLYAAGSLAVYQGSLYVSGIFVTVNPDASINYFSPGSAIGRWDGAAWTIVGNGAGPLAVFQNTLYCGGTIAQASGSPGLASWDGAVWSGVAAGLAPGTDGYVIVSGLAVADDGSGPALFLGGDFSSAGGVPGTTNLAKWDGTTFTPLGEGIRKRSVGDTDFPNPDGPWVYSIASHAGSVYFFGEFREVVAAGGAASVSFHFAQWKASCAPACPADFNNSGSLQVQDIFDFLNAWFAGCTGQPGAPCNGQNADFNGGGLAVQDIFDFLNAWFAGCN